MFRGLLDQEWQQGHETGALDSEGQLALVPGADARTLARDDLSEGRDVAAERVGVFVVDRRGVHLAERAGAFDFNLFLHSDNFLNPNDIGQGSELLEE